MFKRLTLVSVLGYGSLQLFGSNQLKSDFNGLFGGFRNSFGAIYVVGASILDYKLSLADIEYNTPQYYKDRSIVHERVAQRILDISLKYRGVYLKAGQYIGNLDRVMPKEYIKVLKVLQDNGPSQEFDQIKIVIEHDLQQKVEDVFSSFNQQAIAAASLAQVHEAILKVNQQRVAVKIQFPNLRTQYKYDLGVLGYIAQFCDSYIGFVGSEELQLFTLFNTFKSAVEKELDFRIEENNGIRTKELYKDFPQLYIPSYYSQYCSSRMLVMEFMEGVKINDLEGISAMKLQHIDCSKVLIEIFAKMIFQHGHVHCDAHPGNILIRPWDQNPQKPQIILLDHGFYSDIDLKTLEIFRKMWINLAQFNYTDAAKCAKKLGIEDSHIEFLPLIFFYRTINSKKKMGASFSKEERTYVRSKEIVTLENVSKLMRSMPPQLLFVIRAQNLVGIHNQILGGTTRMRLKKFTQVALQSVYKNRIIFAIQYFMINLKLYLFENVQWFYKIFYSKTK